MQIVDFENGVTEEGFRREHPDFPLQLGDLRFTLGELDQADWLVASFYGKQEIGTSVPVQRRILLMTEPGGYFPPDYVNQFGILVSPFNIPGFRGVWYQSHGAVANFFGIEFPSGGGIRTRYDYHAVMEFPIPETKSDMVSVVVSGKTQLPGHRKRLRFVRQLKEALGPKLEIYGRDFRHVPVKADAILPYKYHVALENTVMPLYWSEKIGDAWLGYAFPIVSGPPDLDRWFMPESFLSIDIDRPNAAIDAIRRSVDEDVYAQRLDAILDSRQRLMLRERPCPVIARVIAAHPNAFPLLATPEIIHPMPRPGLFRRVKREASRAYWQVDEWFRSR
ncbi:hypothetical protein BH10PSE9_BH10PSE9_06140 [soil metagenome]